MEETVTPYPGPDDYDENQGLYFTLRLIIDHPSIDPIEVTKELGLTPRVSWKVGTERRTPTGTLLKGKHSDSKWGHTQRVENKRAFFSEVHALLGHLEAHAAFVRSLTDTGGEVEIVFDLPGASNIGDALKWPDLARMANLKVSLGVEVFPEM